MKKVNVLLSAFLAASLAACGSGTSSSGTASTAATEATAAATAAAEETESAYMSDTAVSDLKLSDLNNLTEASSYQIQQLDYLVTALAEDHEYNANFVDGLLENDSYGNLVPCLAESYEPNDDATEWTFHLRKGVKWVTSTGEEYAEVTANDFVAGLRHGAEFNSGTAWLMQGVIKGYSEYMNAGTWTDEEWANVGVKATDDYTVVYTLEAPTAYFASMVTYAVLYPVNQQFLESKGEGCKLGSPDLTTCEFGTTDATSILYNGGYILESFDLNSSTVLKKNEAYWDAEHIYLDSVTRIYDDGSDPYSGIRGLEQNTYAAAGLNASWENFDEYMDKYDGYTSESLTNPTVFGIVFNFNRQIFDNTNYAEDETLRENTHNALLNDNFRKALRAAFDRKTYLMVTAPEELAVGMMRNFNNYPEIVRTTDGTSYGDLVTAAYQADTGEDISLADAQDPWYDAAKAKEYIAAAEAEGVVFPVHLDMLVPETSKALVDRAQSMKQSIEESTDGQIIIELVMRDMDTVRNIAYYSTSPEECDYDISTFTGWSPDYADPKSFVDIYSPTTGYYMQAMGLYDNSSSALADEAILAEDAEIKETVGLNAYEELYRAADAISTDLDARYEAYAKADAYLVERCFFIPTMMQSRSVRVTHVEPFSRVYSVTGLSEYKYKGLKLREGLVTTDEYNAALEAWQKGE